MNKTVLSNSRSISLAAKNLASKMIDTFICLPFTKKFLSGAALIGGLSLLLIPVAIGQNNKNNQQLDDTFAVEPAQQIESSSDPESPIKVEAQSGSPDSTETTSAPSSQVSSVVSIQSTVSNDNGRITETRVTEESLNGQKTKTVTQNSDDGQSKVTYKIGVGAGSDAVVKVKERNGRIQIDVDENKEIR